MPLVEINTVGGFALRSDLARLKKALGQLPKEAPIIICVHGFRFSPFEANHTPHDHILSLDPKQTCRKAVSWPRALGFGKNTPNEGLCIAFAWPARGTVWQAYKQAEKAGEALARVIWDIDRPVQIIAHSMGARVALASFAHLPPGAISRSILMSGAEFCHIAKTAVETPAGKSCEFINVTSRGNAPFAMAFEMALWHDFRNWRSIGSGMANKRSNWCDIDIDQTETRLSLRGLGFEIAPAPAHICHWAPYLRPGLFAFYASALRCPDRTPFARLQEMAPVAKSSYKNAALSLLRQLSPLSFSHKASS